MLAYLHNRAEQALMPAFARFCGPWAILDARSVSDVKDIVRALARVNLLRYGPLNREIMRAAYLMDRPKLDVWANAMKVRLQGYGDCEDLTAAWLAFFWAWGIPADADAAITGPHDAHARIRFPDGRIFDPSLGDTVSFDQGLL